MWNRRYFSLLVLGAAAACGLRIGYVLAEPSSNAFFAEPALDAGYYFDWARRILEGGPEPSGAYYLAPLYAFFLSGCLAIFGGSLLAVAFLQQGLSLGATVLLGWTARRAGGLAAGWWTFFLGVLYHPLLFFSARPMSESLGVFLLAVAILLGSRSFFLASGAAAGVAALARPNFLLIPLARAAVELGARRRKGALFILVGAALAVAPVTIRNLLASGHPVVISSNGGITLYDGNGPGPTGIYNPPDGFSGALRTQQAEATALARFKSGEDLDDVEADRWWGQEAIRERLRHPWETVVLAVRRACLTLDSYEHGLDEAPALDRNPWRLTVRLPGDWSAIHGEIPLIPFGALAGLTAAGLLLRGGNGTGGSAVWTAVLACAVPPLIFYVSSRYRLPLAAVLTIPAGIGASALCSRVAAGGTARRLSAGAAAAAILAASIWMPFDELRAAEEAGGLTNQASAWKLRGDFGRAERLARAAVARDPQYAPARFTLGVILAAGHLGPDAEAEYREALRLDPGHSASAANLAVLLAEGGRPEAGIPYLRRALSIRPTDASCWTNLVIAYAASGDAGSARAAAEEAAQSGVVLEWGLLQAIGLGSKEGGPDR